MWNSGGGFDGGFGGGNDGGFMSTQSQFASPAGQVEKKPRRSQNLIPVTLRSILNCTDDILTISNNEVHMLTAVGLIRTVDVTSTKITYTVDDTTGVCEAVQWVESDQDSKDNFNNPLMEMTYCQLFGSMRTQGGKKFIMIFRIVPVEDPNVITTHILEVMHTQLKLQQLASMPAGGPTDASTSGPGGLSNSMVGADIDAGGNVNMSSGNFGATVGLNAQQNMVFEVIRQLAGETGVFKGVICTQLSGKVNQNQINQALEFLSSEGHIYSTIDEDHFKTTDG